MPLSVSGFCARCVTTPSKVVFGKDDSVISAGFPVLMACDLEASTVPIISDSPGSVISIILDSVETISDLDAFTRDMIPSHGAVMLVPRNS